MTRQLHSFLKTFHSQKSIKLIAAANLAAITCMAYADNPIVSHVYTADPAARVFNGRVYVITSHDLDDQSGYDMYDYTMFSSDDMVNWQDHGIVFDSTKNTTWATKAYAPDWIERNGKYYLYFPNSAGGIGVAVADQPEGPYTDPLGRALVDRNTPNANVPWLFDPGVFIDDDGQAYLYFGGGNEDGDKSHARVIKLNNDMISVSGSAVTIDVPNFFEAAYMIKRNGTYYLSYSAYPSSGLSIDYMTSNQPMTGFTYQGKILPNPWQNNSNNNHASMIEYQGQWYMFYHNRAVANERGATSYQRSINVDRLYFNSDGSIQELNDTEAGVPQLKYVDAFAVNQAETFDTEEGIETEKASGGTLNLMVGYHDWVKISGVDFGSGATGFKARVAAENSSSMEVILDNLNNSPIATLEISSTGGWQAYETQSVELSTVTGIHDVYIRGTGYHNLDWYQFTGGSSSGNKSVTAELESYAGQSSFSPLSVYSDSSASGSQYVVWPNNGNNQILSSASDNQSGRIEITFTLTETSNVNFSVRANFPNAVDDSFYYKLDSGSWNTQNNSQTSGWTNQAVQTFNSVSQGTHTLTLLRREDGSKMDNVTLSVGNGTIALQ